jgi:hypothetical protein
MECVRKKCENEQTIYARVKYLRQDKFKKDFENNKISPKKYIKNLNNLEYNMINMGMKDKLLKCKIDKCYSGSKTEFNNYVSNILKNIKDKQDPLYKLAKKLSPYLKDKRLTPYVLKYMENKLQKINIGLVNELSKCLRKKCKIEHKIYEKNANLLLNKFKKDFENNKISEKKYYSEYSKIKQKMLNMGKKDKYLKCQIDKCYSVLKKLFNFHILDIYKYHKNKEDPFYKLAKKLSPYLKDKKLTPNALKYMETEILKIYKGKTNYKIP